MSKSVHEQYHLANKRMTHCHWPRWLRRGLLENLMSVLIAVGVIMLVQPYSLDLYGWSFGVILSGTLGFVVVSHFPE